MLLIIRWASTTFTVSTRAVGGTIAGGAVILGSGGLLAPAVIAGASAWGVYKNAEQLNLLGFSHGGCVAMAYAAAHPDGVRRLLLVDTLAVSPRNA